MMQMFILKKEKKIYYELLVVCTREMHRDAASGDVKVKITMKAVFRRGTQWIARWFAKRISVPK